MRTPDHMQASTPTSSAALSVVRRDLDSYLTMTGSVSRMREGRREAEVERRKEARGRLLGRELLLPDSSPSRIRRNSAPALVPLTDSRDNTQEYSAPDVAIGHHSREEVGADPNATVVQS